MPKYRDTDNDFDFRSFFTKLKENDERAWSQLNFVLKRVVFKWLNGKQVYSDDAVEIYNNVMVVFYEKLGSLEFDTFRKLKSYVFSIADNKLKEHYREHKKSMRNDEFESVPEIQYIYDMAESEEEELNEKIQRAEKLFDKLSLNEKSVMLLVYKEGKSLKEAAEKLGVNDGNVRVIKYRALDKIRQWYGNK